MWRLMAQSLTFLQMPVGTCLTWWLTTNNNFTLGKPLESMKCLIFLEVIEFIIPLRSWPIGLKGWKKSSLGRFIMLRPPQLLCLLPVTIVNLLCMSLPIVHLDMKRYPPCINKDILSKKEILIPIHIIRDGGTIQTSGGGREATIPPTSFKGMPI